MERTGESSRIMYIGDVQFLIGENVSPSRNIVLISTEGLYSFLRRSPLFSDGLS
jgi:hypothetical protein